MWAYYSLALLGNGLVSRRYNPNQPGADDPIASGAATSEGKKPSTHTGAPPVPVPNRCNLIRLGHTFTWVEIYHGLYGWRPKPFLRAGLT